MFDEIKPLAFYMAENIDSMIGIIALMKYTVTKVFVEISKPCSGSLKTELDVGSISLLRGYCDVGGVDRNIPASTEFSDGKFAALHKQTVYEEDSKKYSEAQTEQQKR